MTCTASKNESAMKPATRESFFKVFCAARDSFSPDVFRSSNHAIVARAMTELAVAALKASAKVLKLLLRAAATQRSHGAFGSPSPSDGMMAGEARAASGGSTEGNFRSDVTFSGVL